MDFPAYKDTFIRRTFRKITKNFIDHFERKMEGTLLKPIQDDTKISQKKVNPLSFNIKKN